MLRRFFILLLVFLSLASRAEELTVSAASSLTNALHDVGELFQLQHPSAIVHFNWGASGTLAQQINAGAPVDVFISASAEVMDNLQRRSLIDPSSRINVVQNQLVLIVPRSHVSQIHDFSDLAQVERLAMGDPRFVPAGRYAEEVLRFFNLTTLKQERIIYGANVRQVLTYVAQSNVAAGLVYKTDALTATREVAIVASAPVDSHMPIVYPAAIVKESHHRELAQSFMAFLKQPEAKALFAHYGFEVP